MTESIFNEQSPVDQPVVPASQQEAPQPPADDSLLKAILNEQGVQKYQSVTDALKALQSSQEHIKRIEQENAQLRDLAVKARAAENIAATLKPTDPSPAPDPLAGKDLESVVERVLNLKESQKQAVDNQREVANVLTEAFGQDKAKDIFYSKAGELGFTREEINALAAKNPKAVIKLFLGDKQPVKPSPSNLPGIRPDALKEKPAVPKSGMTLGSTADLLDSWRAAGQKAKQI